MLDIDTEIKALANEAKAVNKLVKEINQPLYTHGYHKENQVKQLVILADSTSAIKRIMQTDKVQGRQYQAIKFCKQIQKFLEGNNKMSQICLFSSNCGHVTCSRARVERLCRRLLIRSHFAEACARAKSARFLDAHAVARRHRGRSAGKPKLPSGTNPVVSRNCSRTQSLSPPRSTS